MSDTVAAPTQANATDIQAVDRCAVAAASTKDAGRVKVGAGGIRFTDARASTKDAGRVKVGAGGIRY